MYGAREGGVRGGRKRGRQIDHRHSGLNLQYDDNILSKSTHTFFQCKDSVRDAVMEG